MQQEIKFPNKYNQCASFCRKTNCALFGSCAFGFNRIFGGARELRLDFNRCNLHCQLCWSNNDDSSRLFSIDDVFENLKVCISANDKYIHEIVKPRKPDTFKLQSLQIIGGEPLISLDRFRFILEFIQRFDNWFDENFEYCSSCLKLDAKKRFKVKIFTNGVTIGNGEIDVSEITKLSQLNHIRIDLLVSIKGFYEEAFHALQRNAFCHNSCFHDQVVCLEKLRDSSQGSLCVQPVLGFYHSNHFNIKAPDIPAKDMFVFNESPLSKRLYSVLCHYIRQKMVFLLNLSTHWERRKKKRMNFIERTVRIWRDPI